MANLNKVLLIGRLTADPELRHTPSNIAVTSFTLAVNRRYTKSGEQQQADFLDVVCWRNTAEFVSKYFTKGMAAFVSGSVQVRSWKDNNGNNRRTYEIVADEVQFAEPKRDSNRTEYNNEQSFSVGANDFEEMSSDDELPF